MIIIIIGVFLLCAGISVALLTKQKQNYETEKQNYEQERKNNYQNIREEIKQNEKTAIEEEIKRETSELNQRLTNIKYDIVNRTQERQTIETQIKEKQDFNKSLTNTSDELRRLVEKQRQEQQASILSEMKSFREKEEAKLETDVNLKRIQLYSDLDKEKEKLYSELRLERIKLTNEITEWSESAQEVANETSAEIFDEIELHLTELESIRSELDEFRKKRESINEAIRKEQELENGLDSRRIILSEEDKQDIHYLVSIENRINNKEVLHKLIWTEYIQRPFKEMLKRTFGNRNPKCVIYCIENIDTHQKYIGKTKAEVSKRWQEHCKSSLGIGTISHQHIHDIMFGNWDKFSFSIIEEVEEGNINEREKYYIAMFESDKYGYNMRSGG